MSGPLPLPPRRLKCCNFREGFGCLLGHLQRNRRIVVSVRPMSVSAKMPNDLCEGLAVGRIRSEKAWKSGKPGMQSIFEPGPWHSACRWERGLGN
jgi:hypothetical protein